MGCVDDGYSKLHFHIFRNCLLLLFLNLTGVTPDSSVCIYFSFSWILVLVVWWLLFGFLLRSKLRFKLDRWDAFPIVAEVANPLCIDLLCQESESFLSQASADSVIPEIAPRLTKNCLIALCDLFVADPTRVYWRS